MKKALMQSAAENQLLEEAYLFPRTEIRETRMFQMIFFR